MIFLLGWVIEFNVCLPLIESMIHSAWRIMPWRRRSSRIHRMMMIMRGRRRHIATRIMAASTWRRRSSRVGIWRSVTTIVRRRRAIRWVSTRWWRRASIGPTTISSASTIGRRRRRVVVVAASR